MWPFNSKNSTDPADELPEKLQNFFRESDPTSNKTGLVSAISKDSRVQQVLDKGPENTSLEFKHYKRTKRPHQAAAINCAELQEAVMRCYEGWLVLGSGNCKEQIRRASQCMDLQEKALEQLRYNDCYNERQCKHMRAVVDDLFQQHFGKGGERLQTAPIEDFEAAVDAKFDKLWR